MLRQAQGGGNGNNNNKKKKKKKADDNQPLAGAPTAATAAAGGGRGGQEATNAPVIYPIVTTVARSVWCTTPRDIACRSAGRSRRSRNNSAKRCSSSTKTTRLPASRRATQKVDPQEEKDVEMELQDVRRALKAVYGHSNS
jgi:hypothetical protein